MKPDNNRRLGRGLDALLPNKSNTPNTPPDPNPPTNNITTANNTPNSIPIHLISPNPFQPRREFNNTEIQELANSIQASGLIQPITVRKSPTSNSYQLAAGERRLRATTLLGWTHIPANIRELSDTELLSVALIENLQRQDLNPIEEALGYQQLMSEFGHTQAAVAQMVGKDRSTIANMLRILQLPPQTRLLLQNGKISLGHARALLALPNESEINTLANTITSDDLSVRETERRIRDRKSTPQKVSGNRTSPASGGAPLEPAARRIQDELRRKLQTDVRVQATASGRGSIAIAFYSNDDLDRLLDLLLGKDREPI